MVHNRTRLSPGCSSVLLMRNKNKLKSDENSTNEAVNYSQAAASAFLFEKNEMKREK